MAIITITVPDVAVPHAQAALADINMERAVFTLPPLSMENYVKLTMRDAVRKRLRGVRDEIISAEDKVIQDDFDGPS